MPFIGNSVQNQGFAPAVDYFNGDGTTVTFTLSRPVASVAQLTAVIENVIQNPATAFTVSGNQITFTSAPPSGTGNIWVEYTSLITQYNGISENPSVVGDLTMSGGLYARGDFGSAYDDGTVVDYATGSGRITVGELDDLSFYHGGYYTREEMLRLSYQGNHKFFGTSALTIPVGTTAQRPGTPANGMIRYNSTTNQFEVYQNGVWINYNTTYSVEYVVVAGGGGGGGGQYNGGGGGAGGYRSSVTGESSGGGAAAESPLTLTSGTAYTVTIGAGGTGGTEGPGAGAGGNSVFGSITSVGGGRGGNHNSPATGGSGGSGGGGSQGNNAGGSGTSGQGYAGGGTWYAAGAGGGGAGAAVPSGNGNAPYTGGSTGVSGGVGVASSITGSSVFRAGGGGGGGRQAYGIPQGSGGNGGGGNGGPATGGNGSNGSANTGGGGGGTGSDADNTTQRTGGTGGSGVVIIRYLGGQRGTGGTVTSSGGYTIHTFTTSGTYTA